MVKRLEGFVSWLSSITAAAIAVGLYTIRKSIENIFDDSNLTLFILIVIVVILSRILGFLIQEMISRTQRLRRLILGSQFIEGHWIDKVVTENTTESVGILTISYESKKFRINGESLDLSGVTLGTFQTYISEFDDLVLRYAYHGSNSRKPDSNIDGYGEYNFIQSDSVPLSFSGFLHDSRHMMRVHIQANKVYDQDLVKGIQSFDVKKKIIDLFLNNNLLQWQSDNLERKKNAFT